MSKATWKRLPPLEREQWLATQEAIHELGAKTALSALNALRRRRQALEPLVCSPAWVDCWDAGGRYPPIASDPACQMRRADRVDRAGRIDGCFPGEEQVYWPSYYVHGLPGEGVTLEVAMFETHLSARRWQHRANGEMTPPPTEATDEQTPSTTESPSAEARQAMELQMMEPVPHLLNVEETEEAILQEIRYYRLTGDIPRALPVRGSERSRELRRRRREIRAAHARRAETSAQLQEA